jgi:hypothetical protein
MDQVEMKGDDGLENDFGLYLRAPDEDFYQRHKSAMHLDEGKDNLESS